MASFTQNYKLKKPAPEDFADIADINNNMDIIDGALMTLQTGLQNIDCGVWDTDPVAEHNATAMSHANLLVDGNNTAAVDASSSLEEHMANPMAHQNLVIDGNAGQ